MPSSMIFVSLVVLWLLILVPAVARHRQEVARPSVAALSGRVLARPPRRRGQEVDGMSERIGTDAEEDGRVVATRAREVRVPSARAELRLDGEGSDDRRPAGTPDDRSGDGASHGASADEEGVDRDGPDPDGAEDDWTGDGEDDADERVWERPTPRYRAGRGGFDAEAAALAARARYTFRQRVVVALLLAALVTGVVAGVAVRGVWWAHAVVDVLLVGYLVYLRRQVRMEEAIRARRSARMAGTRRPTAADDPELDEWAQRGREAVRPEPDEEWGEDDIAEHDDVDDEAATSAPVVASPTTTATPPPNAGRTAAASPSSATAEVPAAATEVRTSGLSASAATPMSPGPSHPEEERPALPRLRQTPLPPIPAGTALVEEEEAELDLDDGATPGYRRAVGQ